MRAHMLSIKHDSRGFTMMELLAVVAIIAITMAIAFPATWTLQRSMQINQLDQTAKQVYLAAQNRVTALQSSGQLASFEADISTSQAVSVAPSDYPGVNWAKCGMYYLGENDDATVDYVITSAGNLYTTNLPGQYVIEVSPSTGEVYGVFYWESGSAYSYSDIINTVGDRSRAARTDSMIGYYGGNELSDAIVRNKQSLKDTEISLVNDEELYVKLSNSMFGSVTPSNLSITMKVTGIHNNWGSGNTVTRSFTYAGSDLGLTAQSDEVDIILDSMRDGLSFYDIVDGGLTTDSADWIYPGADVTVALSLSYDGKTYDIGGGTVNSLYGSRASSGDVTVSNLRHLNNLRLSKLNTMTWGVNTVHDITLGADIDYNADTWAKESVSIQSREGAVSTGKAVNPLASTTTGFVALDPISNAGGTALNAGTKVNGSGHSLSNFVVTKGAAGAAGIFGNVNTAIADLNVINPSVTGSDNTGALVGKLDGGSISNCGVYLTDAGVSSGLKVSGSRYVGGLVGTANAPINNSFAAIDANGAQFVGGLAGNLTGNQTSSNCYSSGTVTATGDAAAGLDSTMAGGLAGYAAADLVNCYSTSNVFCDTTAGSFAGYLFNASNSFGYGRALKADGTVDAAFTSSTYGFAGVGSNTWISGCTYLQMSGYNDSVTASNFTAATYADLTKNVLTVDNSHPYSTALAGKAFPFANTTGLGVHYGNWPTCVTASWARDNGYVFKSAEMAFGDTPNYNASLTDAEYFDVNNDYHLFNGWSQATDADGNVTFTANSLLVPIVPERGIFLNQTRSKSVDVDGVKCQTLWYYILDNKSNRVDRDAQANNNFTCDSEAVVGEGNANASHWFTDLLSKRIYTDGSAVYDMDSFSYGIDVLQKTYTNPDSENWGWIVPNKGETDKTDNFVVIMGQKIPAYGDTVASGYRVVVYDAGQNAYRSGTITRLTNKSNKYYLYKYSSDSFTPDGGYFSIADRAGDR